MARLKFVLPALFATAAIGALASPSFTLEENCSGCAGSGSSVGTNTYPGCGTVTVSVYVAAGSCKFLTYPPDPNRYCEPKTDCTVTITRTWAEIPSGETVTGCVIQNGQRYCIDPPLASDGGSNSDVRSYDLECGSGVFQWSTVATCSSAPGGRITALAAGSCDGCVTSG